MPFLNLLEAGITVANIKSSVKRIQIAERNRLRNKAYKSSVRTLTKKYVAAAQAYAASPSDDAKQAVVASLSSVVSKIDKAVKRGVYHRNTGARKKAGLSKTYKALVEPASVS